MRFHNIRERGAVRHLLAGVLASWSLFAAGAASAAEFESGLFLGIGYGTAREVSELDVAKSKNNGLYEVFGGFQFRDYFGAEIGYANFDNLQRNRATDVGPGVTQHFEIKSTYGRVFAQLPIVREPKQMIALYVAGGGQRWDLKEERKQDTITVASVRRHDVSTMFGGGIVYRARDSQFRIEVEQFNDIDFVDTLGNANSIDIRVLKFNLMFFF